MHFRPLFMYHVPMWLLLSPISIHTNTWEGIEQAKNLTLFFLEDLVTNKIQEPTAIVTGVVYRDSVLRRGRRRVGWRGGGEGRGGDGGGLISFCNFLCASSSSVIVPTQWEHKNKN